MRGLNDECIFHRMAADQMRRVRKEASPARRRPARARRLTAAQVAKAEHSAGGAVGAVARARPTAPAPQART